MAQKACVFEGEVVRTARLEYLLSLPKGYGDQPDKVWPLILFLHGMGERGDDLEKVKVHGPPKILEAGGEFEFIVVSPQCPDDSFGPAEIGALNALLDEVVETYAVDTDRLYLTGLSMGGYGTWHMAIAYPDRFAAIVPVCGGGMFYARLPDKMASIANLPVWVFHGAQDRTVSVAESADLVSALQACGGNVRFTIYPDAAHDSWTETYENPELYEWLLTHRKQ